MVKTDKILMFVICLENNEDDVKIIYYVRGKFEPDK